MANTLEMTYREALQKSMFEEMDKNADIFLMGEDIGRYEGTFKVTKGFFPKYGTRRVGQAVGPGLTRPGPGTAVRP